MEGGNDPSKTNFVYLKWWEILICKSLLCAARAWVQASYVGSGTSISPISAASKHEQKND